MREKDANKVIIDAIVTQFTGNERLKNIAYDNSVIFVLKSVKSGDNSAKLSHYVERFKKVVEGKLA